MQVRAACVPGLSALGAALAGGLGAEVDVLFRVIRDLKSHGVSIIYISHKLDELMQIGDYITVLRDGQRVAHEEIENVDVPWIIEKMVGKNPAALFVRKEYKIGNVSMRVENITLPRVGGGYVVDHVSFDLHESEIFEIMSRLVSEGYGVIFISSKSKEILAMSDRIGAQAALIAAGRKDVIVVGFDGSDDAIQSIGKGELKATSLQPVAEMTNQAAIQADEYIKNGKASKPEKQSIDMVLITPENYCQYKTFAPTGSIEACPTPPAPAAMLNWLVFELVAALF